MFPEPSAGHHSYQTALPLTWQAIPTTTSLVPCIAQLCHTTPRQRNATTNTKAKLKASTVKPNTLIWAVQLHRIGYVHLKFQFWGVVIIKMLLKTGLKHSNDPTLSLLSIVRL
jgi:Trk-type K+ transport system membrane component